MKKFSKEEIQKKTSFVEGSSIIMAPQLENLEDTTELETVEQTSGEIVDIGPGVKDLNGFHQLKIGDKVHFQRYGAARINVKKHKDCEYWVINGKDILVIEIEEVV